MLPDTLQNHQCHVAIHISLARIVLPDTSVWFRKHTHKPFAMHSTGRFPKAFEMLFLASLYCIRELNVMEIAFQDVV